MSNVQELFSTSISIEGNFITLQLDKDNLQNNQDQTKDIFSEKWVEADEYKIINKLYEFQFEWFLSLYGFSSEEDLKNYLKDKKVIIDTGCGLGYKAAWFAKLAPHAIVLGVDISDSIYVAAKNFKDNQ